MTANNEVWNYILTHSVPTDILVHNKFVCILFSPLNLPKPQSKKTAIKKHLQQHIYVILNAHVYKKALSWTWNVGLLGVKKSEKKYLLAVYFSHMHPTHQTVDCSSIQCIYHVACIHWVNILITNN